MEKFSQKYSLVTFLREMPEGAQFHYSQWPLHVSIVDTFACDKIDEFVLATNALVATKDSIQTEVGEDAYFGPDEQVHVKLVNMDEPLPTLHKEVVKILQASGAVFNDPQYIGDGYKAHITVHSDKSVKTGDAVNISEFSLIDMFPEGDYQQRKILKTFTFPQ